MKKEKTIAELADAEIERVCDAIKCQCFEEWADELETEAAKAELEKVSQQMGLPVGSPGLMAVVAFYAGFDAGAETTIRIVQGGEE